MEPKTPLVSVIMATYNGARYIREAIDSVLGQSFSDFELIIVDDGSTDDTPRIIDSYNDDRMVRIKKDRNSGIADSLNMAIARSAGVYIARMDDDDVCMPRRLQMQVEVLNHHQEVVLCACNAKLEHGGVHTPEPQTSEEIKIALLFKNPIVHPSVMIRKEALLKHAYDPATVPSEDYDLWTRLISDGEFFKIHTPLLFYRYREQSETSRRRKEQLQLNVAIAQRMFAKMGFNHLPRHQENIRIFASHDYSISGNRLRGLINWFDQLKAVNSAKARFSTASFNAIADDQLHRFLVSYFSNRKLIKKVGPFFRMGTRLQKQIVKHYLDKYF